MKTVRIYGMADNLMFAPPVPPGVEVWACNNPLRAYNKYRPQTREEYTRWFNLHSKRHMKATYPRGYEWYTQQTKPIVLQERIREIKSSVAFPRDKILREFGVRYFTFSGAWLTAFAMLERFERIEYYGFALVDKADKPHECYKFERPCFFYWTDRARRMGIEIVWPIEVGGIRDKTPGDPASYTGPLYGYETT